MFTGLIIWLAIGSIVVGSILQIDEVAAAVAQTFRSHPVASTLALLLWVMVWPIPAFAWLCDQLLG